MTPRPLDLGPLTTLTNFGKLPYVRMALAWGGFALLLIAIFWLTHGGFGQVKSHLQLLIEWFEQNGHMAHTPLGAAANLEEHVATWLDVQFCANG